MYEEEVLEIVILQQMKNIEYTEVTEPNSNSCQQQTKQEQIPDISSQYTLGIIVML